MIPGLYQIRRMVGKYIDGQGCERNSRILEMFSADMTEKKTADGFSSRN